MRVEKHNGKNIVCGHIFPASEIKINQLWQGSSGATVTISDIKDDWIKYVWLENGKYMEHEKTSFAFQSRYCLVIDD